MIDGPGFIYFSPSSLLMTRPDPGTDPFGTRESDNPGAMTQ